MAEGGWGFIEFAFIGAVMWGIYAKTVRQQDTLESIDKKMHTHASDGSINGIRGWY